jgi:hypothetical protein
MSDTAALVAELRKASQAIYLVVDAAPAQAIAALFLRAAAAIDAADIPAPVAENPAPAIPVTELDIARAKRWLAETARDPEEYDTDEEAEAARVVSLAPHFAACRIDAAARVPAANATKEAIDAEIHAMHEGFSERAHEASEAGMLDMRKIYALLKEALETGADIGARHTSRWPATLTPALIDLLSPMIWESGAIAQLFRDAGAKIKSNAEVEQAFVLHWLIGLWFEHGDDYGKHAFAKIHDLKERRNRANAGT